MAGECRHHQANAMPPVLDCAAVYGAMAGHGTSARSKHKAHITRTTRMTRTTRLMHMAQKR